MSNFRFGLILAFALSLIPSALWAIVDPRGLLLVLIFGGTLSALLSIPQEVNPGVPTWEPQFKPERNHR